MSTDVEKIYCLDQGRNNDALAYLAGQNKGNDPMAMAAMMNGGMGNQWNNPFIYLVWMMFANRFWNNGQGNDTAENFNSRQIATLQDVVNNNHNNDLALQALNGNREAISQLSQTFNCSFGQMQTAICGVKSAIEQVGGQVGYSAESVKNAILLGDQNITSKICECCCNTNQNILRMGYDSQLAVERQTNILGSKMDSNHASDQLQDCQYHGQTMGRIDQLANGMQQGFAQIGFNQQQNTQAIIQNATQNTQRILDQMCMNSQQELRDKLADKDRQLQTQTIINSLKTTTATT